MFLDFQQKRKIRNILYHRATLAILFVIVLIFLHSTWVVWQKKRASEQVKVAKIQDLAKLEKREAELNNKIERLKTDSGLEEEIRSKFTVAKTGENMVIIVEDSDQNVSTTTSNLNFLQKIWHFFFK